MWHFPLPKASKMTCKDTYFLLYGYCLLKIFFLSNILTLNPPPTVSQPLRSVSIPPPFPFKCSFAISSPLIKLLISFS